MGATKEEWDSFARESIPKLEEMGYLEEKNEISRAGVIVLSLICISLLAFLTFISWQIYEGKFKSNVEVFSNSTCNPITNIPECPSLNCPSIPSCPTINCPACNLYANST